MHRVTIHDVAQAAGVSVSTISKVVNNRDGIALETQRRVRKIIDDLGYVGSVGARSLRAQRTGVIGVLVSQFEPYSAEILKGVGEAAQNFDYEIMAWAGASHITQAPRGWERKLVGRLAGSLIDGAIIVTPSIAVSAGSFPVVAIDPFELDPSLPSVLADDEGGVRAAVTHLVELGHRRIGYLGGRENLESAHARERGFRAGLQEAGLELRDGDIRSGDYTAAGAAAPALELLAGPDRPTAIVAANDVSALAVMRAAKEQGLRLPEDLSVVGFDDVPEASNSEPGLTTLAQPLHEMGALALELLLARLAGKAILELHRQFPTRLVVRASTAAPTA